MAQPQTPHPHDLESERAVLGAVLQNPLSLRDLELIISSPDMFAHPSHQAAWRTFVRLRNNGGLVDITTAGKFLGQGKQQHAEGIGYLEKCSHIAIKACRTPEKASYYASTVAELYRRRAISAKAEELRTAALAGNMEDVESLTESIKAYRYHANGTVHSLAELEDRPMQWIWPGWLANGYLSMLAGDAGIGKTTLLLALVKPFICGGDFPDGTTYHGPRGKVLWVDSESFQDRTREIAQSMGIPTDCLLTPLAPDMSPSFDNETCMSSIKYIMARPDVVMGVVDSYSSMQPETNENDPSFARLAVFLADLADGVKKLIITTHHLRKAKEWDGKPGEPITADQVRGHSRVKQRVRLGLGVYRPMPDSNIRVLHTWKTNFQEPAPVAVQFQENEATGCPNVIYGIGVPDTRVITEIDRAVGLLHRTLKQHPVKYADLRALSDAAGICWTAMVRAGKKVGVVTINNGIEGPVWSLPARGEPPHP